MEEIRRTSYTRAIEAAKNNKMKLIVFFLFNKDIERQCHFTQQLKELCRNIDRITGRDILFLSHYASSENCYDDFLSSKERSNVRSDLNAVDNRNRNADGYKSMQLVAKAINTDIINDFPCYIIVDPYETPRYTVRKYNMSGNGLFMETMSIISSLLDVQCDFDRYLNKYSDHFYFLSGKDLLERDLNLITKGWTIEYLMSIMESYNALEYFDWNAIKGYAHGRYIKVKDFFDHFSEIKSNDIPAENSISEFIDKYLVFFGQEKCSFFRAIIPYIEQTSKEYLGRAFNYYTNSSNQSISKYSLSVICIGKAVEDELNLGIFNAFRGAYGISLSANRKVVQANIHSDLEILYTDSKKTYDITFNKHDVNQLLQYPKIYKTQNVAFNLNWIPTSFDKTALHASALALIEKARKQVNAPSWMNILTDLRLIADKRNDAIHKTEPLTQKDCEEVINAFKNLVSIKFFEANNQLKYIENGPI